MGARPRGRAGLLGTVSAALVLAGCGGSSNTSDTTPSPPTTGAATTTSTTVPLTAVVTTTLPPTTTQPPTTTTITTTTVPEPTTTVPEGPTATDALEPFLAAVRAIMDDAAELWPVIDQARADGLETLPESSWPTADRVIEHFYDLADLVPHGLDPEVRTAATVVLYDVGYHVAPFVFAPGIDFGYWDPAWDTGRVDGGAAVPVDTAALLASAGDHPVVRDVDPMSKEAATDAALSIGVVRSFGHNLRSEPWPHAVRWLGELPPTTDPDIPPWCAGVPYDGGTFAGDFVAGIGGCAIVYYGTTDPLEHEAELQAFLAAPQGSVGPPGEIVSVVWDATAGHYVYYGSWE